MRGSLGIEVFNYLKLQTEELFGKENVVQKFMHPTLKYPEKEEALVFDFYVPLYKIGFDVQVRYDPCVTN